MILGIYSASGGGRFVYELALEINNSMNRWDSIIFIDDTKPTGSYLRNCPIYSFSEIQTLYSPDELEIVIAVGEPDDRKLLYDRIAITSYNLATLVHPAVRIPETTKIGKGVIIFNNAYICSDSVIGDNVRISPMAIIGHDNMIGDHSVISAMANIGGYVTIGTVSYIAISVSIIEHITIGDNTIVSAGSAVLKDIPSSVIAQGNPARVMLHKNGRVFKQIKGINC